MNKPPITSLEWEPCVPGKLAESAVKQCHRQRRLSLIRWSGYSFLIVMASLLSFAVVSYSLPGVGIPFLIPSEQNYGGITCSKVKQNLTAYRDGKLDEDTRTKMTAHFKSCALCRTLIPAKISQNTLPSDSSSTKVALSKNW